MAGCRLRIIALITIGFTLSVADAESRLRIASWNITNYSSGRINEFGTAIFGEFEGRSMSPDVIFVQEMLSASGVANFLNILNTAPGSTGDWAAAEFVNGPDTDNALYYRTTRVALATDLSPTGMTIVAIGGVSPNHPRDINRYDLVIAEGTSAETRLAIYSSHMKSGTGSDDKARRLLEAQHIRDDAEALPADWHFLLGGDFNIQSSGQTAYVELVGAQVDNGGRFFDPINTPGSWNNNASFRFVHTQDPAQQMDDRHDQLLVSASLVDGVGLDYIGHPDVPYSATTWDDPLHSYRSWGNDGTSYDTLLTTVGNQMVGDTIALALRNSAQGGGHLPVFLDLRVPPCLGDFACDGAVDADDLLDFGTCLTGPWSALGFVPPLEICRDYADFDVDQDIDVTDFAAMQSLLSTGP